MTIHIRYNDYVPDVEDLDTYGDNIESPTKEEFKTYKNKVNNVIDKLEQKYDVNMDEETHFIYGKFNNKKCDINVYSFHPEFHDWAVQPSLYIKSAMNVDDEKFKNEIATEIANQLFYQGYLDDNWENEIRELNI